VDDPGHAAGQCGAVRRQLGAEHRDLQEKRVLTEGNRLTRREHSMKGLLYKDLCTLTSRYKKNFLVVFVLYIVWAILFDMPFMLYALVFVLGMYVQSAISFDEYSHWDMYGHTLPVRPAALVGSKYILGGSAILAGCLLAAAAFMLSPVAGKGDS